MAPRKDRRDDPVASALLIVAVTMIFILIGMTLAAGAVLAMPSPAG